MGRPFTGAWAATYQLSLPYTDARKWGTGVNPVHAYRGDPGRPYNPKLDANEMGFPQTQAHTAIPQDFIEGSDWGYQSEDIAGLDVFANDNWAVHGVGKLNDDAWPEWADRSQDSDGTIGDPPAGGAPGPVGPRTGKNRALIPRWTSRPWQFTDKNSLRSVRGGESEADTPGPRGTSSELPTETVSEGWVNKGSSGGIAPGEVPDDNVMPSSTAQYERNTSMQQRHKTLNNERAVMRGTDATRTEVASRIAPMKIKIYSGQQRHYDMFPYQLDDMPRGFRYRTAGTGPSEYMTTNEQQNRSALQRNPPPDPSMGIPESELTDEQFGYSTEDQGYY